MALEAITGTAATYQNQTPKASVSAEKGDSASAYTYSGSEGSVSAISKDTLTVKDADNTSSQDGKDNAQNGEDRQPSQETMKQALSDINRQLNNNTECVFSMHDKTNRVMIQIIDKDTKEVVKELPPEKTLDMIAKVWELAGILVDEKL